MTATITEETRYAPSPLGTSSASRAGAPAVAPTEPPSGDEVSSRFLQFLIPVAASVASTFAPQVGSAIGGLFGGSSGAKTGGEIGSTVGGLLGGLGGLFGGRSLLADGVPFSGVDGGQAIDLTGPLVEQCTLQCLSEITPELATMLTGLYPQLKPGTGDSRSAQAEIAAVERFWPEIAAFITQKVATHLPEVIKTVTSTVMPLLGSRDTAEFRPMLTGTEANSRWFVPALTSILTAVQQTLPHLLSVIGGGQRAPRDTSITWTDLSVYGRFWDNDFIRVVGQGPIDDSNAVEIVLELAPHLNWGKEIQIRDDNGALIHRLHVQDANKWAEARVAADQILTNGSLLLAKAKMFGIMTGMYVLPTAGLNDLRGKRTHIRWMSD